MTEISNFRGHYEFLSNFSVSPIEFGNNKFRTVEHAYQCQKTCDYRWYQLIRNAKTPAMAKRLGRQVPIRDDWDEIKLEVMAYCLNLKFEDKALRAKLVDTGQATLIEGNTWGDTFWGVCKGKGENHLGRLLMQIRNSINAQSS